MTRNQFSMTLNGELVEGLTLLGTLQRFVSKIGILGPGSMHLRLSAICLCATEDTIKSMKASFAGFNSHRLAHDGTSPGQDL